MSIVRPQPAICIEEHVAAAFALVLALSCAGCASPGPPRPPSLNLPALVTDLNAERVGDRVVLNWTTPSSTTDDLPIKGGMSAQVCRETRARSAIPGGRLAACAPVVRLAVASGASEVADTLPRTLISEPVGLITYRVQIFNAAGRSAGDSLVAALAAAGTAPPPVEAFSAKPGETGAILEWRTPQPDGKTYTVDVKKLDASALPSRKEAGVNAHRAAGREKYPQAQAPREIHLRVPEIDHSPGGTPGNEFSGMVDSTATFGETHTYRAERVRSVTVSGHLLEIHTEPSADVTMTMRDTFPPRTPSGLASVPSVAGEHPYIDLSWEPNSESDLAGYFIYRQSAKPNGDPQGHPERLVRVPVSAPAFRDMAVTPGQRYSYSVTAVDASGNESAPSALAQEVIPFPN